MKKQLVFMVIFVLLLSACDFGDDNGGGNGKVRTEQFWAYDFEDSVYYRIQAELLAENNRCEIWVEKGIGMSASTAQAIADEFANNIYRVMMNNFGWTLNIDDGGVILNNINTMEWANYIATEKRGNQKTTILFFNIRDGFNSVTHPFYIGGYFWPGDFFDIQYSNQRTIIYLNANPLIPEIAPMSQESNGTIVHEMQHLMNFVTSLVLRFDGNDVDYMDTWVNEGLSESAEWVYFQSHKDNRINWFEEGREGSLINRGNNFFAWDSHDLAGSVLDDYSTVYLFFQWLRLQSRPDIFSDIIVSKDHDYRAVLTAFNKNVPTGQSGYGNDWGNMLRDWYAANYMGMSTGRHGYRNDARLNNLKTQYFPAGGTTASLFPGEAVYSRNRTTTAPNSSGNIRYNLLSSTGIVLTPTATTTLLTYNVNINTGGSRETGTVTGVSASISADGISGSRNILDNALFGPHSISAEDMLRRNARKRGINSSDNRFSLNYHDIIRHNVKVLENE
jgi:hypothetical protein